MCCCPVPSLTHALPAVQSEDDSAVELEIGNPVLLVDSDNRQLGKVSNYIAVSSPTEPIRVGCWRRARCTSWKAAAWSRSRAKATS